MEYLAEEATVLPLSLALEEEGFGLVGGEMSVAIGEDGLVGDFRTIATDGEPTGLDGDPNDDFGSGELGPLGSVSPEDKSNASLVCLTALAFFFNPLGIGGEGRVVAFVATKEAMGWVAGGGVVGVSLFAHLDAIAVTLEPLLDLFMEEAPP